MYWQGERALTELHVHGKLTKTMMVLDPASREQSSQDRWRETFTVPQPRRIIYPWTAKTCQAAFK
ncbi:MAG: hypothetical protein ACKPKO_21380, partial [Candidatus Fonsibacter sp.]